MEYILVAISLASLICNVALVRRFLQTKVATLEVTESLPLPRSWQDAAELGWDIPVYDEPPTIPAAVPVVQDNSPWVNRSGIQQGVNAAPPAPPLPPIQPIVRPPLARPDGFV